MILRGDLINWAKSYQNRKYFNPLVSGPGSERSNDEEEKNWRSKISFDTDDTAGRLTLRNDTRIYL